MEMTLPFETTQARAATEHLFPSARIHGGHIATFQSQRRDEPQHIARLLQGGELPVDAVAHAAHGPRDEGTRQTRPEGDSGESRAVSESTVANTGQSVRECERGEPTAATERIGANTGQSVRECEGGCECEYACECECGCECECV